VVGRVGGVVGVVVVVGGGGGERGEGEGEGVAFAEERGTGGGEAGGWRGGCLGRDGGYMLGWCEVAASREELGKSCL
jgi:hypothetical protein